MTQPPDDHDSPLDSRAPAAGRILPAELHFLLLEQYAAPSVLVTEEHVIVHVSATAGRFLHVPGGEPSRDVMRLIVPPLRAGLRTALQRAAQGRSPAAARAVRIAESDPSAIRVVARRVSRAEDPRRAYFLVLFEEEPAARRSTEGTAPATAEPQQRRCDELERRNAELTAENRDLKAKVDELGVTNDGFNNLVNATDVGTIFLDRDLRVKLFTRAAQQLFNLRPGDRGGRLFDVPSRLNENPLHEDAIDVLERLQTVEREVSSRDGRHFAIRILPHRTTEDRIDGVLITCTDVTSWRRAEARARASEERLRLLIDSAIDYAIFTITENGRVASWNAGAERMFGYRADEITGQSVALLFLPEDRAAGVPQEELARAAATGRAEDERWHIRKDGTRFYASGVTTRLGEAGVLGFAKIARDLTAQRETEVALRESRHRLEERVRERTAQLEAEVREHAAAKAQVTTLLQKMVTAQEAQRARMARDLHDQLGQQLTALRLALERHRDRCSGGTEDLERSLGLVRQLDDELDFLSWELRPAALDDLGLPLALPRFVDEWSAHYGVATHFTARGEIRGHLPAEAEITFYRIAQEALNNVLKHAHASRVDVLLERRDGAVVLVVEDDGIGFDPADAATTERGLGLIGMRERALLVGGTLDVESSPGGGATVYFRYPVAAGGPSPA